MTFREKIEDHIGITAVIFGAAIVAATLSVENYFESRMSTNPDLLSTDKEINELESRLKCIGLEIKPLLSELPEWKHFMQVTAETYSNHGLRQARTAQWFGDVDDAVEQLQRTLHYANGQRSTC